MQNCTLGLGISILSVHSETSKSQSECCSYFAQVWTCHLNPALKQSFLLIVLLCTSRFLNSHTAILSVIPTKKLMRDCLTHSSIIHLIRSRIRVSWDLVQTASKDKAGQTMSHYSYDIYLFRWWIKSIAH